MSKLSSFFGSGVLAGLFRSTISNPNVQKAGEDIFSGILKEAHSALQRGDYKVADQILSTAQVLAPAVVGAILTGTVAEEHAAPAAVEQAKQLAQGELPPELAPPATA